MNSEKVWLTYYKDLKHYILSEVKDQEITKDILQEVFIKMHTHLHLLKEKQKCKQWLLRITRNTIIDHYRKQKKIELSVPDLIHREQEPSINEHFTKCLTSFIPKLPKHYRDALILSDLKNQEQIKIATHLKISYSGAKSRIQRGRTLLKSLIQKCCDVSSDKYGNIISYKSKQNCNSCSSHYSVNRC